MYDFVLSRKVGGVTAAVFFVWVQTYASLIGSKPYGIY